MSGIFGIFDPTGQVDIQAVLNQMARAMSYGKWHVADFFADTASGGGLGSHRHRDPEPRSTACLERHHDFGDGYGGRNL